MKTFRRIQLLTTKLRLPETDAKSVFLESCANFIPVISTQKRVSFRQSVVKVLQTSQLSELGPQRVQYQVWQMFDLHQCTSSSCEKDWAVTTHTVIQQLCLFKCSYAEQAQLCNAFTVMLFLVLSCCVLLSSYLRSQQWHCGRHFSQPFKGLFEGWSKGLALRCNGWSFIFVRHSFSHASYSTTTILINAASKWLLRKVIPRTVLWFISKITTRSYRLGSSVFKPRH